MTLCEKLKERFGVTELTPEALDRFTGRDFSREGDLVEAVLECDPAEIRAAGLLVWVDNRTQFSDQHETLVPAMRAHFGVDYERYNAATRIVFAADTTRPLSAVQQIKALLTTGEVEIRDSEEFVMLFGPCRDLNEAMKKLETYNRLTSNRLTAFYNNERIPLFSSDGYSVTCMRGYYEHWGGFCLSLNDQEGELMSVSGWLHNNTRIVSIHGAKPPREGSKAVVKRLYKFRDTEGIHPGNLTELMYLKFGQCLGHSNVRIASKASERHNNEGINSKLYLIPARFFGLQANPENSCYEFDSETRDTILAKQAVGSETVRKAFQEIERYMVSGTPPSV